MSSPRALRAFNEGLRDSRLDLWSGGFGGGIQRARLRLRYGQPRPLDLRLRRRLRADPAGERRDPAARRDDPRRRGGFRERRQRPRHPPRHPDRRLRRDRRRQHRLLDRPHLRRAAVGALRSPRRARRAQAEARALPVRAVRGRPRVLRPIRRAAADLRGPAGRHQRPAPLGLPPLQCRRRHRVGDALRGRRVHAGRGTAADHRPGRLGGPLALTAAGAFLAWRFYKKHEDRLLDHAESMVDRDDAVPARGTVS